MKPGGKTALITGIGGQDGSYLAELLLDQGYAVNGLVRRSEFVERAAAVAGFEIAREGSGPAETGYDRATGRRLVAVEPRFFQPLDHSSICGSAAKARAVLGWEPTAGFARLVEIMMESDLAQAWVSAMRMITARDVGEPELADGRDEAAAVVGILGGKHIHVLSRARKAEEDRAPLADEEIIDPGSRKFLGDFLSLQGIERRPAVHSGGAG